MASGRGNQSPDAAARRRKAEAGFLRLAALAGVVGLGAAIGAILGTVDVRAWVIGLVVAIVSLVAAAVIRRSIRP